MSSFEVTKNIWEQLSKPPKSGIIIKENLVIDEQISLCERSNEEMPYPNIMSVMVTDVDTSEDRMTGLEKKIDMLIKAVEEKDNEIASLKNHIERRDAAESSHTHIIKNTDKGKTLQESQPQNLTSIASLSIQQLQEMIANTIKTQYGGPAQTLSLYSKPYKKRIDNLRMPNNGYQPPKFQQFDGKGNPRQHVAHFIETCETFGTRGDLLVK